jgi:hypothetical protein
MRKKLIIALFFFLMAWGFTACESDCEFCKLVTRTPAGDEVDSGAEAEHCGAELIAFKAANPDITNPVTHNITRLECH